MCKQFIFANKAKFVFIFILALLSSAIAILIPLSIGKYMEIVYHTDGAKQKTLQLIGISLPNNIQAFYTFFAICIASFFIINWLERFYTRILSSDYVVHLREIIIQKQFSSLQDATSSKQFLLLFSELKDVKRMISNGIIGTVKHFFILVFGLYILFLINGTTTLLLLLIICIAIMMMTLLSKKQVYSFKAYKSIVSKLYRFFNSRNTTAEAGGIDIEMYRKSVTKNSLLYRKWSFWDTLIQSFASSIVFLILIIVMLQNNNTTHYVQMSQSNLMSFLLILLMMFSPIKSLLKIPNVWMKHNLHIKKLAKIVEKN